MTLEEAKRLRSMSCEEQKAELLDGISDNIRSHAKHIAMLKAISRQVNGIEPEDFDKALNRQLDKEWDKLKGKNQEQLAMIALGYLMEKGIKPIILADEMEE